MLQNFHGKYKRTTKEHFPEQNKMILQNKGSSRASCIIKSRPKHTHTRTEKIISL